MTVAFWCILAAPLAPYFLSVAARSQVSRAGYVDDPRAYSETLGGWHRRAHLAHLNAFEAAPTIIAGVMLATFAKVPQGTIDALALAFVGCSALHAAFYLADRPMWRSHAWRAGMLCVIGLFVASAWQGTMAA